MQGQQPKICTTWQCQQLTSTTDLRLGKSLIKTKTLQQLLLLRCTCNTTTLEEEITLTINKTVVRHAESSAKKPHRVESVLQFTANIAFWQNALPKAQLAYYNQQVAQCLQAAASAHAYTCFCKNQNQKEQAAPACRQHCRPLRPAQQIRMPVGKKPTAINTIQDVTKQSPAIHWYVPNRSEAQNIQTTQSHTW